MPERFTSIVDAHVILRRSGKILLLRRAGDVYASGQLCLPSGHLEEGENILQTAIRETCEETGIILDPGAMRLVLSIHQRNQCTTHTRVGFVFEPSRWAGDPVNREPSKCSGLVWADSQRLPPDVVEYTAVVLHAVRNGATFAVNGWPEGSSAPSPGQMAP